MTTQLIDVLEQIKNQVTATQTSDQGPWLDMLQQIANSLQAGEDAPGIVQLASTTEAAAGSDTSKAVTPAGIAAAMVAITGVLPASTTVAGTVELATSAETITGTDTARAVTPAGMAAVTTTTSRSGLVELATSAETITGTDTARAVTPAGLTADLANLKMLGFTGKNGAGACTCTGAAVGDRVLAIAANTDGGGAKTLFETAITVINQIQQSSASDLSTKAFTVILLPTS